MIALPSIAFEGFSGSAKGVTARRVGGRNILSVKSRPTGATANAQVVRRALRGLLGMCGKNHLGTRHAIPLAGRWGYVDFIRRRARRKEFRQRGAG